MTESSSAHAESSRRSECAAEDRVLAVERRVSSGTCPRCGSSELCTYPVHTEGGWFESTKCQMCLKTVNRIRGNRLGPIVLLSDSL